MRLIDTDPQQLPGGLEMKRSGPHVVAIGGGHGLARALGAIRHYASRIDAVVTVADDGGSSGRLSPALDIPPPGDIRKCLIALTEEDSVWRRLYEYRFEGADVRGHSLGNLIIAALAEIEGSFEDALRSSERLLGAAGSVIPVSPQHLRLEATIDGEVVAGQAAISASRGTISALRVRPERATANPHAIEVIGNADQIVLGPGSLFTSVLAALVVPGIIDAVNEAPAALVFVANLITQDGETLGMDAADHIEALIRMTGVRSPAAIVANNAFVDVAAPLELLKVDRDVLATYGVDLAATDLIDRGAPWPQHDQARLADVLESLSTN